ncbi:MAG: DUF533 domain-containing protein [Bacteroidales bacterium]|jgi:hypothetical protein|nr:DUF533 domain-containing protein [Bacteroidales bacterium]
MYPSAKKWLYAFEQELTLSHQDWQKQFDYIFSKDISSEEFVHFYIHNSGIFYGHSVKHFLYQAADIQTWNYADKFKIAIVEGLVLVYYVCNKQQAGEKTSQEIIHEALECIERFYLLFSITESIFNKNKNLLHQNSTHYQKLESIIDYRVNNPSMLKKGFWKGSQFNIFAYLDLYFFCYWLQNKYIYEQKNAIKCTILTAMIAAAHVDNQLEESEKSLISYFIASGNFSQKDEAELLAKLQTGCIINSIQYNTLFPYDIQLLVYEYAILAIVSNKNFNLWKEQFLGKLAQHLHIKPFDAQHSIMLIQNFVIQNFDNILYLNVKNGFDALSKNFSLQIQSFLAKNKVKFVNEIMESKELVELLWKAKNEKLTHEEREKVKSQIIDIIKTIPSFAIFMLPGGTILLPLLYKFLPEEIVLPSAFQSNKTQKKELKSQSGATLTESN